LLLKLSFVLSRFGKNNPSPRVEPSFEILLFEDRALDELMAEGWRAGCFPFLFSLEEVGAKGLNEVIECLLSVMMELPRPTGRSARGFFTSCASNGRTSDE
jgi:hypothetical protein